MESADGQLIRSAFLKGYNFCVCWSLLLFQREEYCCYCSKIIEFSQFKNVEFASGLQKTCWWRYRKIFLRVTAAAEAFVAVFLHLKKSLNRREGRRGWTCSRNLHFSILPSICIYRIITTKLPPLLFLSVTGQSGPGVLFKHDSSLLTTLLLLLLLPARLGSLHLPALSLKCLSSHLEFKASP